MYIQHTGSCFFSFVWPQSILWVEIWKYVAWRVDEATLWFVSRVSLVPNVIVLCIMCACALDQCLTMFYLWFCIGVPDATDEVKMQGQIYPEVTLL